MSKPCEHNKVKPDAFARLPGVRRTVPGDVMCANCHEPLPVWWNGGDPITVDRDADTNRVDGG